MPDNSLSWGVVYGDKLSPYWIRVGSKERAETWSNNLRGKGYANVNIAIISTKITGIWACCMADRELVIKRLDCEGLAEAFDLGMIRSLLT